MDEKRIKIIRWAARILSLLPILFFLAEVLFPHGGEGEVMPEEWIAVGLLFISVIALACAWCWEKWGAIISIASLVVFLIAYAIIYGEFFPLQGLLLLSFILIPAILFLVAWQSSKQTE